MDNVPNKVQLAWGARVAPFYSFDFFLLRDFRIEVPSVLLYFPDARETLVGVPIMPYAYWQWTF